MMCAWPYSNVYITETEKSKMTGFSNSVWFSGQKLQVKFYWSWKVNKNIENYIKKELEQVLFWPLYAKKKKKIKSWV